MDVIAKANRIRMSPRKVRLVIDLVRGLDVDEARQQLRFVNKAAKQPVIKVIESAIANAENNFNLDKHNLFIKKIAADQGPTLKRWLPRAFGRATPLRKRSTHITVILGEKVESKKIEAKKSTKTEATELKTKPAQTPAPASAATDKDQEAVSHQDDHKPEPIDVHRQGGQGRDTGHQDKRRLADQKHQQKVFNRKAS